AGRPVGALPVGAARRLELARALATGPTMVLLDEPFSGLDPAERAALARRLVELPPAGVGVVLVEHDVDLVLGVSDRVVVLNFGEVLAAGTPAEVRADPRVRAAYLGTAEVIS